MITSTIKIHDLYKNFYNIRRFFNKCKWDFEKRGLRTLEIIRNVLKLKGTELFLDDTFSM